MRAKGGVGDTVDDDNTGDELCDRVALRNVADEAMTAVAATEAVASGMCANDGDAGRTTDARRDVADEEEEDDVDMDGMGERPWAAAGDEVVNGDSDAAGERASRRCESDDETAAAAATLVGVGV